MIHAIKGVFSGAFIKRYRYYEGFPKYYTCQACSFSGTLEEGIEHVVKNQFWVRDSVKKSV